MFDFYYNLGKYFNLSRNSKKSLAFYKQIKCELVILNGKDSTTDVKICAYTKQSLSVSQIHTSRKTFISLFINQNNSIQQYLSKNDTVFLLDYNTDYNLSLLTDNSNVYLIQIPMVILFISLNIIYLLMYQLFFFYCIKQNSTISTYNLDVFYLTNESSNQIKSNLINKQAYFSIIFNSNYFDISIIIVTIISFVCVILGAIWNRFKFQNE